MIVMRSSEGTTDPPIRRRGQQLDEPGAAQFGEPGRQASSKREGVISRESVRDQRIDSLVPLLPPRELLDELALSPAQVETVVSGRAAVQAILAGTDDRLLAVVGPCSVHDVDATLEYARRLSDLAARLRDEICVAMRVYFEKPRTTTGWKGLINDPYLDGSGDVNTGLRVARRLLLEVLALGLPVGCEFLDPITPQYISDTVCWGAIGARTTESQIHRQLGSGLSMPVGFKNRTDGNVQVAVDAVRAAAVPHAFAGIDVEGRPAVLYTRGNSDCHVILRGGRDRPNYTSDSVAEALALLRAAGLRERVVIDVSHDNSRKDHNRQPLVAAEVGRQVADGNRAIMGVMLESFLLAGRQDPSSAGALTYGQSITDGCIDWPTTVEVLEDLAKAAGARRERLAA
jgi:3-deoxy-7-phosphoheptulonate synthase